MNRKKKNIILGKEILYNNAGQVRLRNIFLVRFTTNFFRFFLKGL